MKRIAKHIALIMAFVSCFLSFTSYAFAQSDNNKHNSLAKYGVFNKQQRKC